MKLEKPLQENSGVLKDKELKNREIMHLPSKLGKAINGLEKDNVILDAMGDYLFRAYIA